MKRAKNSTKTPSIATRKISNYRYRYWTELKMKEVPQSRKQR